MKKLYLHIVTIALPLFVIWVFLLAMRNNFDLSNVRINLYATVKQFELISTGDWNHMLNRVNELFSSLDFNFDFQYVNVTDAVSFFKNIGIWINGYMNNVGNFIKSIGYSIGAVGLFIVYFLRYVFNIFNFVFNPIQF